ncbi:hypothetical protein HS125_07430 [bacterium]|nr:hypothetical protein [bacterium]
MTTLTLRSYVGADGILKLKVPKSMQDKDVKIVLSVDEANGPTVDRDSHGWPIGYVQGGYANRQDLGLPDPPDASSLLR